MKYLGEEKAVEIKTIIKRPIEYVRCDKCGKKILPFKYKDGQKNQYINIHTWHSDWGNDSIDSHEYKDYCQKCAKEVISEYIDKMHGTEELELTNEYLFTHDDHTGTVSPFSGYKLVKDDKMED